MPALGPIRYITIHCAATPEDRHITAETMGDWARAKFGQISYHWVIELDGKAVRTLRDDQKGAHTGGANSNNIGICYVGGMDRQMARAKDTRTIAQKKAMRTLIRTYLANYPDVKILGHRNWPGVKKDCPSFDVTAWIKAGMPE